MKQNISEEQFDELTQEHKAILIDWLYKDKSPITITSSGGGMSGPMYTNAYILQDSPVLLSIGQMIEFIIQHNNLYFRCPRLDHRSNGKPDITVGGDEFKEEELDKGNKELCDKLWEAVKCILGKSNNELG